MQTATADHKSIPGILQSTGDFGLHGKVLGRIGVLEVRLACDDAEVEAAQELRYRVFYEELGAKGAFPSSVSKRDSDRFDAVCDHVLVVDTSRGRSHRESIVGTYRVLRQDGASLAGGFYSEDEFEFASLMRRHPAKRFLELGRSCVLPEYRSKRTIEALWQGIWAYVLHHGIDVMAGCASFHGTVPAAHAEALTLLANGFRAGAAYDVKAKPGRYNSMDLMPCEAIDAKRAFTRMPPLIKGYLRLGARIGDGCVIDTAFETVDVFVVMPVNEIRQRYVDYYSGDPQSLAA